MAPESLYRALSITGSGLFVFIQSSAGILQCFYETVSFVVCQGWPSGYLIGMAQRLTAGALLTLKISD
ncbi:MAG: hypothetical protein KAT58_01485, partial [candidate division Zixibacteria bacterium]|nr:hypothetical protein [candidate division Zixibacteria bacterium]